MAGKTRRIAGEEWRGMEGRSRVYDPGRESDVLRRARASIREIRMREAELVIRDRTGKPLAGVEVEVEQTRHAFPFGCELWHLDALVRDGRGDGEEARAWKRKFAELFNAATNLCYWTERPRNDASKTEESQGEWRLENFAETVAWTLGEGLLAKGHPLFWSIPKCVPDWVKRYDPTTQLKFAEVRVRNIVARFRGKVTVWDAVNEPMWEAVLKNLPVRKWPHIEPLQVLVESVAPVLRWCREEDPDATYLVNDYGMEQEDRPLKGSDGSTVTAASQRRRFVSLIRALQEIHCAPDAIGLQSHTGGWIGHGRQWEVYDEFASTGLPVHITEFWADTRNLEAQGKLSPDAIDQLQADYVANYVTCAFGHPAVEAFFFWGFMGRAIQWCDRFSGHEEKPVYGRLKALIQEEWRTRATLTTDREGRVRFRGFLGNYAVRRPMGPVRKGVPFRLDRSCGLPLSITL